MADWSDHRSVIVAVRAGTRPLCLSLRGSSRASGAGFAAAVGEGSRCPLRSQFADSDESLLVAWLIGFLFQQGFDLMFEVARRVVETMETCGCQQTR